MHVRLNNRQIVMRTQACVVLRDECWVVSCSVYRARTCSWLACSRKWWVQLCSPLGLDHCPPCLVTHLVLSGQWSWPVGRLWPVTLTTWLLCPMTNDPGCRAGDPSHFVLSYHFVLAAWASQASDPDPMVLQVRSASVAFHSTENQSNVQVADQQVAAPVETFRSWNSNR